MAGQDDDILFQIGMDLSTIKRQLRQLGQDITSATNGYSKTFAKAGADIDKAFAPTSAVQKRINELTGVVQKSGKQWTGALAEQGKAMEDLRKKYNPIFSAVKQYQASIVEIQQANRLGAISADEMAAAIQRERQATLASIAAIKQRNAAQRGSQRGAGSSFNTANIAAQFQDIGVTTAMGMNPLQIALQQGTQLSAVLEQLKHSGQSTGAALVGAFTSIISPVSLVTIGLIAAGAAAAQYFLDTKEKAKTLDDAIGEHAKAIADLRKAYGIAGDAADDFGRRSTAALEAAARRTAAALRDAVAEQEKAIKSSLSDSGGFSGFGLLQRFGLLGDGDLNAVKLQFAAFAEPIKQLRAEIEAGKPDYDAFEQSLQAIVNTDPSNLGPIRDELLGIIDTAADGRESLDSMSDSLNQISEGQFSAAHIVSQIYGIEQAAYAANDGVGALKRMLDAMGGNGKGDSVGGPAAMERAAAGFKDALNMYRRFGYDNDSGLDPNKPRATPKARHARAPAKTADDRFFEDIEAIRQRTAALAQEQSMLGATFEEQTRRKTAFDLETTALKQVREEARRKGEQDWQNAQLTPQQVQQIDEVSAAYARQADELRKAQANMDLQRDVLKGVFSDFRSALEDGKLDWQDFANIAMNALDKIIDKIENDLIDAILSANSAGGGGGLLGGLFGLMGGGFSQTGSWASANAGFASGTANTGGVRGQPAGIVHGQEAVIPLPNGGKVPVQIQAPVMPTLAAGRSGSQNVSFNMHVSVSGDGDKDLMSKMQKATELQMQQALTEYDRHVLPERFNQIARDPRQRG